MSRLVFHPLPVQPSGANVRIDTASGSNSPASGLLSVEGSPILSTLASDGVSGAVPAFLGPDGTTTLYVKTLNSAGAVTATATLAGTSSGSAPPSSTDLVAALVNGAPGSLDTLGEVATALAALPGAYAPQPGSGVVGKDVQTPTTRTVTASGFSVLMWQNNDSAAPDNASRVYLLPRAGTSVTTGTAAAYKLFFDDYSADQTNYRDVGFDLSYFNSDSGYRLGGVAWLNSKVNGTWAGKNPDIGFCMQDGQYVAGRVSLATVGGTTPNIQWVFGAGKPIVGQIAAVVAEFQGNIGLNSAADTSFRWTRTDGVTGDNLLAFQRHASGGQIKATLGSTQRLLLTNAGSLVLGNGSSATATNSTDGFLYVNSMAGTPTGTPTAQGAAVPLAIDTTGSKLWAYIGGAWKSVTLA